MKIALITIGFSPYRTSGLDVSAERLVMGLLAAGHEVDVLAGRREHQPETFSNSHLSIQRIQLDRTDWLGFGWRAAHILGSAPAYDIIHFADVDFSWAFRGEYIASVHHSFNQRILSLGKFQWRQTSSWLMRGLYYRLAQKFLETPAIQRARGIIACTTSAATEYINSYPVSHDRLAIAHHGVDTDHFVPVADTRILRNRLGITENDPVILFVGFITPRKGLEYLAQALPLMKPTPRLVLVGQWRNKAYRQQVMEQLGSFRQWVVEVGVAPDDQMPAYYSMADVYVSPSLIEGFGIPAAEALACQTSVVATDTGSVAEVVGPGGILVQPRDVFGLANAVSYLLNNPDERHKLGCLGREHVVENYSLPRVLREMVDAYQRFRRK